MNGGISSPILSSLVSLFTLFTGSPPIPQIDVEEWWGPAYLKGIEDDSIRPFRVEFNDSMIRDLRFRLRNTRRLTPPLEGSASEYGFNTYDIGNWIWYWAEEYPFHDRLKHVNKYSQFKTTIQGLEVHFVLAKPQIPPGMEVVPLLMLHGWPSSFLDFYEIIPTLTAVSADRNFAIEVVAASLPGFTFSDGAARPGFGADKIAVVLRNLMRRLGYKKFYIHGADWGSVSLSNLATYFPEEVLGYHSSMPLIVTPLQLILRGIGALYSPMIVRPEVEDRMYPLSENVGKLIRESGYFHQYATKPDTVNIALTDSPAGLLAYYLEKISVGTNYHYTSLDDGGLHRHFTREKLIDNLMMYWASNSMATAGRIYAESFSPRYFRTQADSIQSPVPTWILQAKFEIAYTPPWMYKLKFPNLLNETVIETGGHFLAMEQPQILAEDVLKAIVAFRRWHDKHIHSDL